MARAGLKVQVFEAAPSPGGGLRTAELIEPDHFHDVCSAVHPMALASPFFRQFELSRRVPFQVPDVSFGSPLDGGRAALAYRSLDRTAAELGRDGAAYRRLMAPLVRRVEGIADLTLNQLVRIPRHPVAAAAFGLRTLEQGSRLWNARFRQDLDPALLSGVASGAIQGQGIDPDVRAQASAMTGMAGTLIMVIGVISIVLGILMIIAGVGVMQRKAWGRMLSLVLAVLAGVVAVLSLVQLNIISVLLQGAYCAFVLIVLLNKDNTAEFVP